MKVTPIDYTTMKGKGIKKCLKCGRNGKHQEHKFPRGSMMLVTHKSEIVVDEALGVAFESVKENCSWAI